MNIKQQYKLAFQKLIVFPGDWHTLKNYQPEIMKVYYHVGLRAQAVSCGFRSSTFKSLEFCGNFKRTHCFFLLQDIISFCNCIFIIRQSKGQLWCFLFIFIFTHTCIGVAQLASDHCHSTPLL